MEGTWHSYAWCSRPQHCQRAFSLQIKWFEWLDQCCQETDDCGSSQRGQSCVSVHVLRAPSASTRTCPSATCAHTTATLIHELATVVVSIMWLRAQHACSTCVCVVTPSLCMRRNMAVDPRVCGETQLLMWCSTCRTTNKPACLPCQSYQIL